MEESEPQNRMDYDENYGRLDTPVGLIFDDGMLYADPQSVYLNLDQPASTSNFDWLPSHHVEHQEQQQPQQQQFFETSSNNYHSHISFCPPTQTPEKTAAPDAASFNEQNQAELNDMIHRIDVVPNYMIDVNESIRFLSGRSEEISVKSDEFEMQHTRVSGVLAERRGLENELDHMRRSLEPETLAVRIGFAERKVVNLEESLKEEERKLEFDRFELFTLMERSSSGISELLASLRDNQLKRLHQLDTMKNGINDMDLRLKLLEELDGYMESMIKLVLNLRYRATKMYRISPSSRRRSNSIIVKPEVDVELLINSIDRLLNNLISQCFIVTSQPPQVIKTNNYFDATIRLLGANIDLIRMIEPTVEVALVYEMKALGIIEQHKEIVEKSLLKRQNQNCQLVIGKFKNADLIGINERHYLKYDEMTKQVLCQFKKIKFKIINRPKEDQKKRPEDCVTDEKYSLVFYAKFILSHNQDDTNIYNQTTFNENVTEHHLMAFSQPMIVTVAATQDVKAYGTASWHNAAAEPGPPPYIVNNEIEWEKLFQVLSRKFELLISARDRRNGRRKSRPLSPKQGAYLLGLIPHSTRADGVHYVNLEQFARENLVGKEFTFWEWFYGIQKLVNDNFIDYWLDEKIEGFVSKDDINTMLCEGDNYFTKAPGTFVIRFSEQRLGSVALACKMSHNYVKHLCPYNGKELLALSLAERIGNLTELRFLYPDISKDIAFGPSDVQAAPPEGYSDVILHSRIA